MWRSGVLRGILVLLGAISAGAAEAQTVQGRVVDETGQPVAAAVVALQDEQGQTVRAILAGTAGTYSIAADRPGRFRIRIDRIGLTAFTTPYFELAAGAVHPLEITVPTAPVMLDAILVDVSRRCEVRPQDAPVIARLWEDARTTLALTHGIDPIDQLGGLTAVHYLRELDASGAGQTAVYARQAFDASHRVPFGALDGSVLLNMGFSLVARDGLLGYYAPSAVTLLSDAFLEGHCFDRLARSTGAVGLRFRPAAATDRIAIGGTIWLDEETLEVRTLEYDYHDPVTGRPNGGSGRVEFVRLPNGASLIALWWIRLPSRIELPPPNVPRGNARVLALSEAGGIVLDRSGHPLAGDDGLLDALGSEPLPIADDLLPAAEAVRIAAVRARAASGAADLPDVILRAVPGETYTVAEPVIQMSLGTLPAEEIERTYATVVSVTQMLVERFSSLIHDPSTGGLYLRATYLTAGCSGPQPPLYLINGVPMEPEWALGMNPRDVLDVNVLRFGAETAMYGLRGACGVIQIRTR